METQEKINSRIDVLEKELAIKTHELEIEAALERVRTEAMSMKEPVDMPQICKTISHQLELLGVREIRNVQTAIFYESKSTFYPAKESITWFGKHLTLKKPHISGILKKQEKR